MERFSGPPAAAVELVQGASNQLALLVALAPHFTKEEDYALPPLGLLKPLADGKTSPDMQGAVEMASRLKADLPHMLEEHQAIVKALDHGAHDERVEAAADVALPPWHGRDVGLHGDVAVGLCDPGVAA